MRTAGLKAIQEVLNDPSLKLREAKDVRWLSHDSAVQTLQRTLPAVLTALEREAAENGEPLMIGLVRVMKCYEFVACLNLMWSFTSPLTSVSPLSSKVYTAFYD